MNVACRLERAALSRGELPAVARGSSVVASYAELGCRVAALAGGMRAAYGLQPGDRVAWPSLRTGFSYAPNLLRTIGDVDPRPEGLLTALHAAL